MKDKKILIISLPGIGNTVLFTPFLNSFKKNYPTTKVDFLVLNQTRADAVSGSNLVDEIFVLPRELLRILKTLWQLRKNHYDYSVTAFPSNKWEYNVLALLIGAKERVTHSYQCCWLGTLSFLQNKKIPAIEGIHDVEQNMNLLEVFNINPEREARILSFHISDKDKEFAEKFLKKKKLENDFLVGIHPGCSENNKYRRWPSEHFIELIDNLTTQKKKIFLFGSFDEIGELNRIYRQCKERDKIFLIQDKNLKHIAALIAKCKLFICNDSGLGHIAATYKIPVLAIIGPTQPLRTKPYGECGYYLSLNLFCSPCLKYPFRSTTSRIKCKRNFKCLREIKASHVLNKIKEILE